MINNKKNAIEQQNRDLNEKFLEFKRKISEIKNQQEKGILKTVDLVDSEFGIFNVEDLTYEDMDIFDKVQTGTINKGDLERYRKKIDEVSRQRRLKGEKKLSSREIFYGFIVNLALPILLEKREQK